MLVLQDVSIKVEDKELLINIDIPIPQNNFVLIDIIAYTYEIEKGTNEDKAKKKILNYYNIHKIQMKLAKHNLDLL